MPQGQGGRQQRRGQHFELMRVSLEGLSAILIALSPPEGDPNRPLEGAQGTSDAVPPPSGVVLLALTGGEDYKLGEEVRYLRC